MLKSNEALINGFLVLKKEPYNIQQIEITDDEIKLPITITPDGTLKLTESAFKEYRRLEAEYRKTEEITQTIKSLFANKKNSLINIINKINEFDRIDKIKNNNIIYEIVFSQMMYRYGYDLSEKQIDLLSHFTAIANTNPIEQIVVYDDCPIMYSYFDFKKEYKQQFYGKLDGYRNIEFEEQFLGLDLSNELNSDEHNQRMLKYYQKEKYKDYLESFEKMLKEIIDKLKLDLSILVTQKQTFVTPGNLYLDKSILELYNAKVLQEDITLNFILLSQPIFEEPIVKKGQVIIKGKENTYTFTEKQVEKTIITPEGITKETEPKKRKLSKTNNR